MFDEIDDIRIWGFERILRKLKNKVAIEELDLWKDRKLKKLLEEFRS